MSHICMSAKQMIFYFSQRYIHLTDMHYEIANNDYAERLCPVREIERLQNRDKMRLQFIS